MQTGAGKTADIPPLPVGEGWGEGSKIIEKQEIQFMSNIAHPHPDPPPGTHAKFVRILRGYPGEGEFRFYPQTINKF